MHRRVRKTFHPIHPRPTSNARPAPSQLRIECTCVKPPRSSQASREVRTQSCTTPFHHTLRRAHRTQVSASAPSSLRDTSGSLTLCAHTIALSPPAPHDTCGDLHEHCHLRRHHHGCAHTRPPLPCQLRARVSTVHAGCRASASHRDLLVCACPAQRKTRQARELRAPAHSLPPHPHLHPTAPWW
jgi:hypothetical protein